MQLGEAVAALAVGHVVTSAVGMGAAAMARRSPRPDNAEDPAEVHGRDAHLTKVVSMMYSGGGLDSAACTDDVTFTDPAASCHGRAEVAEAFRALRACHPEHIQPPLAGAKMPLDDGSSYTIQLHQRYFAGARFLPMQGLEVHSTLIVRVASDGRICAFEERWNGAPLFSLSPFRFARRVNGLISAMLTPLLV